jgi:excisionase family DNA binding protein
VREPNRSLNERIDTVESSLISLLQEVRQIKSGLPTEREPTLEPLLEAKQVAELLGVDRAYIYSQSRAGKIPSIKLGKYRKFSPSQLKKWLDRKS